MHEIIDTSFEGLSLSVWARVQVSEGEITVLVRVSAGHGLLRVKSALQQIKYHEKK